MQAIRVHATGAPDVMKYEKVDIPTLKEGEILVKNHAVGINYIDTYHRSGLYKLPLPLTLGREGAGVVEKVGPGVTAYKEGDRVAYQGPNSYAEYAAVPASKAIKLSDKISFVEGAAILLQGLTAHYLVRTTFPVNASHTVLIHAGAGGLGQLLIQLCKHLGAKVITTVSTPEKVEIVKALGADHPINYSTDDFAVEVKKLTNGKGVNVVYDSVGATTWQGSINSLAPLGLLVLCGNASGPVPPIDPLLLSDKGSLFVTRPTLVNYIATPEAWNERCTELIGWIESGALKISPPQTFPLSQAKEAHEALEGRKTVGKVVLIP